MLVPATGTRYKIYYVYAVTDGVRGVGRAVPGVVDVPARALSGSECGGRGAGVRRRFHAAVRRRGAGCATQGAAALPTHS